MRMRSEGRQSTPAWIRMIRAGDHSKKFSSWNAGRNMMFASNRHLEHQVEVRNACRADERQRVGDAARRMLPRVAGVERRIVVEGLEEHPAVQRPAAHRPGRVDVELLV